LNTSILFIIRLYL